MINKLLPLGHTAKTPCPYCQGVITLVSGWYIYEHREDLWELPFWQCASCKAYSGCHKGTTHAKGRVANHATRQLRVAAHAAIDPIWKSGHATRSWVYAEMGRMLGTSKQQTHVGWLSDDDLHKVIKWGTVLLTQKRSSSFASKINKE